MGLEKKKLGVVLSLMMILVTVYFFNKQTVTSSEPLIIGRAVDSESLDPARVTDAESFKVSVNIYENLLKISENGKIEPCLASSWDVSEDEKTWTFQLKKNIKFQDGEPFNAESVVFNFERWKDEENPYHRGTFHYWDNNFKGTGHTIISVKAVSEYGLEIELNKPYAPFLSVLATPAFGIASPEAIKKYKDIYDEHPVGTGAYELKKWDKGERIVLQKNKNYWGQMAAIDEIEFRVIPDKNKRLEALRRGKIHIAEQLTSDDIEKMSGSPDISIYRRPFMNIGYLALNNGVEPLNSSKVRKAISYAIDNETLVGQVYNSQEREANSFLPPVMFAFNGKLEHNPKDIQKAKALLDEVNFDFAQTISLSVMSKPRGYMPKPIETAEYIKKALGEIGIKVEIRVYNWDEYLEHLRNGQHQMAIAGWNGDNFDPDNFLYTLFASSNAHYGSAVNYAFFKNDRVDMLLENAREMTDRGFRESLYQEIQNIVYEETASIPLIHTMPIIGVRKEILNFKPSPAGEESLQGVKFSQ